MKKEISDIHELKLQKVFKNRLEKLKKEVEAYGIINWAGAPITDPSLKIKDLNANNLSLLITRNQT
jgi:hypothetical protein